MTNTTSPSSPTTNNAELEMRALVTSKEAGIIIGKGGKNVASIRTLGVRAGVSKVVTGVHERILTISGTVDALASAFGMVAQLLQEGSTIKLLVANGFMGSIIGKQGTTIRRIQDSSSCRLNVSKEQLPNSGERMIELFGTVEGIESAVREIAECITADNRVIHGTILFVPSERPTTTHDRPERPYVKRQPQPQIDSDDPNVETRNVPIHVGLVGCIIGKGGSFINHIREVSGSRISISKMADPVTNQRVFTVTGSVEANEKALALLFAQLESEKEKRLENAEEDD